VAIVFASDNYGMRAATPRRSACRTTGRADLGGGGQPNTIVVLNDNSAILMPWLSSSRRSSRVLRRTELGSAIAALLFGDVNPSGSCGHVPTRVAGPANTTAQWPVRQPGAVLGGAEGRLRWYTRRTSRGCSRSVRPVVHTFAFGNLQIGRWEQPGHGHGDGDEHRKPGRDEVAQLYVGDPAAVASATPAQGFQRVTSTGSLGHSDLPPRRTTGALETRVAPGRPPRVHTRSWCDSSRALPLTGTLTVPTSGDRQRGRRLNGHYHQRLGTPQAAIANPYGCPPDRHPASLSLSGTAVLSYSGDRTAAGFRSAVGVISGAGTVHGTARHVTGRTAGGQSTSVTFVWTVS